MFDKNQFGNDVMDWNKHLLFPFPTDADDDSKLGRPFNKSVTLS